MTSRLREWGRGVSRPFTNRAHRVTFYLCAACLSFYFSYILFLAYSPIFQGAWETAYSLLWFVIYAALLFFALCAACKALLRWERGKTDVVAGRGRLSPCFFGAGMGMSLLLLGVSFMAAYPGAVTYDIYNQWMQAETGLFNSWHPVFHTLLLWLGGRLSGSYSGVVALQLVCFSAVMAYLLATLRAWGMSKALLLVLQVLIVTSPLVDGTLMSAGKDSAMTLGAAVLCAQTVNLYLSRGEWIKRLPNAVAFGAALAFTTLVRHNAFFYTVPLLVCALCAFERRRLWVSAATMIVLTGLVMGPLYGALDLVRPNNTLEESVGIPMTILCDTRAQSPELLGAETSAFLETLLPEAAFQEKYVLHSYNSIKFEWPREYITGESLERLLRMTLQTAQRNPRGAFETYNAVTGLVWDVTGKNKGVETARNSGDLEAYRYQNTHLNQIGGSLKKMVDIPRSAPGYTWLFQNIGVQLAILLLSTLWALYKSGPGALALGVPTLLYHLGTMLLLCGNDARFFQFSMALCLPAALALWRGPMNTLRKAGESVEREGSE